MTRFIGIDFSTTSTGVAIFDRNGLQTHRVKSKPAAGGLAGYYARVFHLSMDILSILDLSDDDVVAIESPIVMGRRTDTEIRLHYAWHRFVEYLVDGVSARPEPLLVTPAVVKQLALGDEKRLRAKDGKAQMVAAVERHFGRVLRNDDEADAVWVAVGASVLAGRPVIDLPSAHMPKAWKTSAAVGAADEMERSHG